MVRQLARVSSGVRRSVFLASLISIFGLPSDAVAIDSTRLACGSVATRPLAAGEEHLYELLIGDTVGVVDVTDVSGTIGTLRIASRGLDDTVFETCSGSQEVGLREAFEVSDCIGEDAGTYAIAFNVTAAGPENCGVPLTCGGAQAGSLAVPGEVDSFTFPATETQQVRITVNDPNDPEQLLRLRLFDFHSTDWWGESCSGTLDATIQTSGPHTLLVSACDGTSVGPYTVTWERLPGCGAQSPPDELAYVFNAVGGTLAGVRTASNRVESLVPTLTLPDSDDDNTVAASADGAFVYVSTLVSPVIAAVNTTTNRVSGTAVVPAIGVTFALHPDARHLYAPARAAGGVVVIDTATMKISTTIAIEGVDDGDGVAISPDGSLLYVVVRGGVSCQPGECAGKIAVIDTAGNAVTGFIEDTALSGGTKIRVSPSGRIAYVFDTNLSVVVVDLQAGTVIDHIAATVLDLEFTPNGARAYATEYVEPRAVVVIDAVAHDVVDSIPLPDITGAWGIAISPTSGLLYVANTNADTEGGQQDRPGLVVVDPVSRSIVGSANTFGGNPTDAVLVRPPDGLCAGDDVRESKVTVGELVTSVNFAIDGCPGEQLTEGTSASEASR